MLHLSLFLHSILTLLFLSHSRFPHPSLLYHGTVQMDFLLFSTLMPVGLSLLLLLLFAAENWYFGMKTFDALKNT